MLVGKGQGQQAHNARLAVPHSTPCLCTAHVLQGAPGRELPTPELEAAAALSAGDGDAPTTSLFR